jgi:D-glucosaminate-6-phosphate ammonia-lyase
MVGERGQISVFERLGVKRVINGQSWVTALGGSIMSPEVVRAMGEATSAFVDMDALNRRAGEVIAKHTGAEAGLVTAGASAALVLQVAACMTGTDEAKIARLPDTSGMRNEVVIQRTHRNRYDGAYRLAGANLVEIGTARATAPWELEAAITDQTVAVAYVMAPFLLYPLSLEEVITIAHRRKVPVILDAAAELPPASNLTRFVRMGADLVCFSGGKGLRGPQASGILCGRKDLVEAAFLNSLNFDSPHAGVGRPMKASKEAIIGLVTALEVFAAADHEAERQAWRAKSETIVKALEGIPGLRAVLEEAGGLPGPQAVIYFDPLWSGPSAAEVVDTLKRSDPPIYILAGGYRGELYIVPVNLQDGEEEIVAHRLREYLTARPRAGGIRGA